MSAQTRPIVNLLRMSRLPIYTQLLLEEALLRGTKQNWVLLNDGAFQPAIVMGISGRPEELINIPKALDARIQVIKRFTGGGTVVVDENTVFSTLIFQGEAVPGVECYPQPIMRWTESFYRNVFGDNTSYGLRENDYVFGARKFGGNAQAITGQRWLHHTSLLWDYEPGRMGLLAQPRKAPAYRAERAHEAFVVRLREVVCGPAAGDCCSPQPTQQEAEAGQGSKPEGVVEGAARAALLGRLAGAAGAMGFDVREVGLAEASAALAVNKTWGTKLVDLAAHVPPASTSSTTAAAAV